MTSQLFSHLPSNFIGPSFLLQLASHRIIADVLGDNSDRSRGLCPKRPGKLDIM